MANLVVAVLFFMLAPQQSGVVTGIVRNSEGTPAEGTRVYAMKVPDDADAVASALEAQVQTDRSGRYRLELPAGRYTIASGSVSAPTYFPGTQDVKAARVIAVEAGGAVADVDFTGFVPRPANPIVIQGTGELSGMIRNSDGSPAAGTTVLAVPTVLLQSNSAPRPGVVFIVPPTATPNAPGIAFSSASLMSVMTTVADANGRYVLRNLPDLGYYIMSGPGDRPSLYPGTLDPAAAKEIKVSPTTKLGNLDFSLDPAPQRFSIRGRIVTGDGAPTADSTVRIQNLNPAVSVASGFGMSGPAVDISVLADGRFELKNVVSGQYTLNASIAGTSAVQRTLTVASEDINDVEIEFKVATFHGHILLEDGTPVPEPTMFQDAIVTTVDNPNIIASTIMPITETGTFARVLEAGHYRFYLRNLPEEFEIRSITAGGADLMKGAFRFAGSESLEVDIRVALRREAVRSEGVRVTGTATVAGSGARSPASRVTLCCMDTGSAERLSTSLLEDGSFSFASVPAGLYQFALLPRPGGPGVSLANSSFEVVPGETASIDLISSLRFRDVMQR